jgi:hypothetical protein
MPVESKVENIKMARSLTADGIILFSYDFTLRVGELNPDGGYLQKVKQAAFDVPRAN